jgi:phosphoribosylformimino-5-aminoimidazole carboxamide ribotide isomerase
VIVYPAIDIRGGRCVRLVEGDFARETAFDADPSDAARRWADAGAEWLHVVDLDGSVAGKPTNLDAIEAIRKAVSLPIELGGGLRSAEHFDTIFDLGITRGILGTAVLKNPELAIELLPKWGDRLAVGLDARDGRLAATGWMEQTDSRVEDVATAMRAAGIQHFVFTDIRRDGTLTGPNLPALTALVELIGGGVIASGGVGSIDDIPAIAATGASGVIIGRAIYDGRVDLAEAIALAKRPEPVQC